MMPLKPFRTRVLAAIVCPSLIMLGACSSSGGSGGGNQTTGNQTGGNQTGGNQTGGKKTNVTLVYGSASLLYTPINIAVAKGYFTDAGLSVKTVVGGSGNAALAAVIGGSADIAAGGLADNVVAASKGQPLMYFCNFISLLPNNVVLSTKVAKEKGITADSPLADKVKALKGLKIGVTKPGSVTDQVLRWLLKKYSINPQKDVQILGLGGDVSTVVSAIEHGRVDALLYPSPTPEILYSKNDAILLINFEGGEVQPPPGYLTGLMATKSYLDKHPDVARGLTTAIGRAETLMHNDLAAAQAAAYPKFKTLDKKVFDAAMKNFIPAVPKTPAVDTAAVQSVIDFVKENESIKNVTPDQIATDKYVSS